MFAADNEFDIPLLVAQGETTDAIVSPVMAWGSVPRGMKMHGTWAFYVDDYRFAALARNPVALSPTHCSAACELNFTLFEGTPRAEVVWATYRKRLASRTWQAHGIDVRVDLNVPRRQRDLCMLGVPQGWRAFATRGYAARIDDLRDELAFAAEWAAPRHAVTMVYGGGRVVEQVCRESAELGAVYVPAHTERRK